MEGVVADLDPWSRVHHRRLRLCAHSERFASAPCWPRGRIVTVPTLGRGTGSGAGRWSPPSVVGCVGGAGVGRTDRARRHHGRCGRRGSASVVRLRVGSAADRSRRGRCPNFQGASGGSLSARLAAIDRGRARAITGTPRASRRSRGWDYRHGPCFVTFTNDSPSRRNSPLVPPSHTRPPLSSRMANASVVTSSCSGNLVNA